MEKEFTRDSLYLQRKRERFLKIGIYTFLILTSLPILLGYIWLFTSSFAETLSYGIIPKSFTLKNWRFLSGESVADLPNVWLAFLNTLILALGVTTIVVGVSTPAGYAISRLKFKGRSSILAFTLILHAFPGITLLIGLYYILRSLHLLNSVAGVILARSGLFIPFGIWVMKGFFDGIPWDLEMSALVDGATRFQAWYKIMLPMVKPGIAAISIFAFITGWSEFIFVITFILNKMKWTLSGYINAIIGEYRFVDYGLMVAASVFYMIPVLVFFLFTQKYLMQVTIGGVKGGR